MKFGDLTYPQIREYAASGCLAVVPTGCTEQQGPHLPVDIDTWFAEAVCLAAAEHVSTQSGVDVLVLPPLPFGPTPEHRGFGSGYIDLPQELHEQVVWSVLQSLADQGFERIVVWPGCGQHALGSVVERFNREHRGRAQAFLPEMPYHEIWMRIGNPDNPGGHADAFTTSVALHLRPESVRRGQIVNPESKPVEWGDPNLDFSRYTNTGVIGDPTEATPELGARLWDAVVQSVAETFKEIAETPVEAG
jgi:creatinine amidohydrolase